MLNLCGWANHIVTMPYGRPLQECRKMLRTEINHAKISQFHAYQEVATLRFLRLLLKTPESFYELTEWYVNISFILPWIEKELGYLFNERRHTGSILLKIVYGYDTVEGRDPMIALVRQGIACLEEATSPGQAIELFPLCECAKKLCFYIP